MKILAPLNAIHYLQPFIDAGADEFFLGFYEEADENRFGRYFELNRMSGFRRNSSRFTFKETIDVIKEIKALLSGEAMPSLKKLRTHQNEKQRSLRGKLVIFTIAIVILVTLFLSLQNGYRMINT